MDNKGPKSADVVVGSRVRMARMMAGDSQEKLGEALGLTFQQVQKYEKGANRINASRLVEIAAVYGKPIEWFFVGAMPPRNGGETTADDPIARVAASAVGLALAEAFVAMDVRDRRVLLTVAQTFAERRQQHLVEDRKTA